MNRILPIIVMSLIHLGFIYWVGFPSFGYWGLLFVLPLIAYYYFPLNFNGLNKVEGINIIAFGVGLVFTLWLQITFNCTNVVAASIVGLLGCYVPLSKFFSGDSPISSQFPLSIYAGAFSGMSALNVFNDIFGVVVIGVVGGIIFISTKNAFTGLGGKLGSIGFGAALTYAIFTKSPSGYDVPPFHVLGVLGVVLVGVAGAVITFYLAHNRKLGIVKASAFTTFLIALPLEWIDLNGFAPVVAAIFMGGTFVGMSGESNIKWSFLVLAGIFYGVLFYYLSVNYNGLGGTLGTTACLSCLMAVLLQKTFQRQTVRIQAKS